MNDIKIEPFYQQRAKQLVDMMFDNHILHPNANRDEMQILEDYIAFEFQSQASTAAQCAVLTHEWKAKK